MLFKPSTSFEPWKGRANQTHSDLGQNSAAPLAVAFVAFALQPLFRVIITTTIIVVVHCARDSAFHVTANPSDSSALGDHQSKRCDVERFTEGTELMGAAEVQLQSDLIR